MIKSETLLAYHNANLQRFQVIEKRLDTQDEHLEKQDNQLTALSVTMGQFIGAAKVIAAVISSSVLAQIVLLVVMFVNKH